MFVRADYSSFDYAALSQV